MATNLNNFNSAEANAKPAIAEGHARHSTYHDRASTSKKYHEPSQWPIVDLISHRLDSHPAGADLPASPSHGQPKTRSGTEDIGFSAMEAVGKRASLHGANMPQSSVAKPGHSYKGMEPMERFLAETYGQYLGKSIAAKPRLKGSASTREGHA